MSQKTNTHKKRDGSASRGSTNGGSTSGGSTKAGNVKGENVNGETVKANNDHNTDNSDPPTSYTYDDEENSDTDVFNDSDVFKPLHQVARKNTVLARKCQKIELDFAQKLKEIENKLAMATQLTATMTNITTMKAKSKPNEKTSMNCTLDEIPSTKTTSSNHPLSTQSNQPVSKQLHRPLSTQLITQQSPMKNRSRTTKPKSTVNPVIVTIDEVNMSKCVVFDSRLSLEQSQQAQQSQALVDFLSKSGNGDAPTWDTQIYGGYFDSKENTVTFCWSQDDDVVAYRAAIIPIKLFISFFLGSKSCGDLFSSKVTKSMYNLRLFVTAIGVMPANYMSLDSFRETRGHSPYQTSVEKAYQALQETNAIFTVLNEHLHL